MLSFKKAKSSQLLGNNRRLISFILSHNERRDYPLVDDKIRTHQLLVANAIPVPESLGIISSISETKNFNSKLKSMNSFVVKPAKGSTGNGIVIVNSVDWSPEKSKTLLTTTRKETLAFEEFVYYLSMILSGIFSLGGHTDRVLMQEKLRLHPFFEPLSYKGIPDIRIIVFKGFPVMAMVRLPTKASGGRGNLHQGAMGCGIDLKTGKINYAVCDNRIISDHPDFENVSVKGRVIPYWQEALQVASRCSELSRIQYLGVDIVIDPEKGPLVLEMNARPGLSIQLANQKGLVGPLEKILSLNNFKGGANEKTCFAQENF